MSTGERSSDLEQPSDPAPDISRGVAPGNAVDRGGKPIRSFATWMGAAYVGTSRWPSIVGGGLVVLAAIGVALWLVN